MKIGDFLSRYPLSPFLNNRVWWLTVLSLQVGGKARELQKFSSFTPLRQSSTYLFVRLVLKIFQVGCGSFYLFLLEYKRSLPSYLVPCLTRGVLCEWS